MPTITIDIPSGSYCLYAIKKPCVLAKYNRRYSAYNCRAYNRLLKGGDRPEKCQQCAERCERDEGATACHTHEISAYSF